jgi:hypothetical protein
MSMKAHLRDVHEKSAEHHIVMAKIHGAAVKKAAAMEDGDAETFHKAAMAEHAQMAEHHLSCCKTLDATSKAMGMDGGDWPEGLSAIVPELPANIRAVPRAGQREIELGKLSDGVDPELAKAVGLTED